MQVFIIGFGWSSDNLVIEAPSLDDAKNRAASLSMAEGLLDDDLADTTYAVPYSDDLAHDLGLLGYTDDDSYERPIPARWNAAM